MVHYEFPLNEAMRTWLRLMALFDRLDRLAARDDPLDHHHALATAFEVTDIAARVDLRADLLRELERYRVSFAALRGHPSVDVQTLGMTLSRLESSSSALQAASGKLHHQLAQDEFLMSLKSRIGIPAGTCEFDLPAYRAWQLQPPADRRRQVQAWLRPMEPYVQAIRLVVDLVRQSGSPQRQTATDGQLQLPLTAGRPVALVRVGVPVDDPVQAIPEVSGHRLMLAIRIMRLDPAGNVLPCSSSIELSLTLCSTAA